MKLTLPKQPRSWFHMSTTNHEFSTSGKPEIIQTDLGGVEHLVGE